MEEKNNKESIILLIFILIMFSSKLWNITFDIIKSFIYVILIIYFISLFDKSIAESIKKFINNFYNIESENNFLRIILSKFSGFILSIFKSNNKVINKNGDYNNELPDDLKHVDNKNLEVYNYTNNRQIVS